MADILAIILMTVAIPCVLLGILCNTAVALCIMLTPALRTRTNALVVNLALSGLLFLVTVVPFLIDSYLTSTWRYAEWYCHLTARLSFLLVGVTVVGIGALGLYRYFCVVHRNRTGLSSGKMVAALIGTSWLIPTVMQLLIGFTGWTKTFFLPEYGRCTLQKDSNAAKGIYDFLVLAGVLIPLAASVYSYLRIIIAVKASARRIRAQHPGGGASSGNVPRRPADPDTTCEHTTFSSSGDPHTRETSFQDQSGVHSQNDSIETATQRRSHQRRRHRLKHRGGISRQEILLTKICAAMFVVFFVCYGPIFAVTVVYSKGAHPPPDVYMVCTVIYWLGSCINPVLYATLQTDMREKLWGTVCKLKTKCGRKREEHHIDT